MRSLKRAVESLAGNRICFGINAHLGGGGQGEFLRQMVLALDHVEGGQVFSRFARADRAQCVNLPFSGFPWRVLFGMTLATRLLRRRRDWLTLFNDVEFDNQLARQVGCRDLFDGIMAQCCVTMEELERKGARLVLTSLNTHIDHLIETLEEEHRRLGFKESHFIHPRMRQRALREIELADRIRVNSEWAKRTFVERGVASEKVHVIYPAIDRTHFCPIEKKDDVFRVLVVSSIEPRKGVYYILQAFEEAKIPRSELVLIGGTGDRWSRRMLEGFLQRNSNIRTCTMNVAVGPVSESYGSASVLVHPAVEDGYGLVIPQALACGRPVIATRQSGASELIRDGKNGFVVGSRSIKEIKERLQILASDRNLWEAMSKTAPEAVAHLDYSDFAREVLAFYAGILA